MSNLIAISSNYRTDLAAARAAGLSFPKSPKSAVLYGAIEAYNAAVTESSTITAPLATAESMEMTTYDQPESYDPWVAPELTYGSIKHYSFDCDTNHSTVETVTHSGIQSTLDCDGDDTTTLVEPPHSPVLVALVIMAAVWFMASQLVKAVFKVMNLAESYWKSSQPVDYFAGLDDLLDDNNTLEMM